MNAITHSCLQCDVLVPALMQTIRTLRDNQARWRSVAEELPEHGVEVFTRTRGGNFDVCWIDATDNEWAWDHASITHWMPIPNLTQNL